MKIFINDSNRTNHVLTVQLEMLWRVAMMVVAGVLFMSTVVLAQKPAASLEQIRNGSATNPVSPAVWQNGNAGNSNAHYVESHSIGYRALLTALPANTSVSITMAYDIRHSSKNAIDFLTHYDRLQPHGQFFHDQEVVDPTIGTVFATTPGPVSEYEIPRPLVNNVNAVPGVVWDDIPGAKRLMTMWGATITNIQYDGSADLSVAQSEQRIVVTFTTDSDGGLAVLAWGGHIANRNDWGFENGVPLSAGGINGSPYHMRLKVWTLGNLGNQDRSLSASAVIAPPGCALAPLAAVCGGSVNTRTTSAVADSYNWSILSPNTSGAFFTNSSDANLGTSISTSTGSVMVNAGTGPGSYTLKLVTVKNGIESTDNCEQTTTVSNPERPVVTITEATLCGSLSAPKLTVNCPVSGTTYTLTQTGVSGSRTFTYNGSNSPVEFLNLVAGASFSITATINGCVSAATDCNNNTNSCPSPAMIQQGAQSSNTIQGIEKEEGDAITVYPVPFSNKATVEFKAEKSGNYVINLYDLKGTLLRQLNAGSSKAGEVTKVEVDGRDLAEGIYLIRMVNGTGTKTVKLLKKN